MAKPAANDQICHVVVGRTIVNDCDEQNHKDFVEVLPNFIPCVCGQSSCFSYVSSSSLSIIICVHAQLFAEYSNCYISDLYSIGYMFTYQ